MGAVYRVRDVLSGEMQALKRLIAKREGTRHSAIEAFEREYQVLASLDHPRIIRVFDYGVDSDGPYYTMELLDGQDLRAAAPLPFGAACGYLRDIATSLALLHSRHLLHRDLSPSNVRVTPDGHCKLLDFGALTDFGPQSHIVGTPPLVAPEALSAKPLDQRADLYALGALAYWTLTGRHAFPVRTLAALPSAWAHPPLPPSTYAPGIPADLDALVMALLSRDPLARPGSAAEVIPLLDGIAELEPEDNKQSALLAQSFFATPRFTGRSRELQELTDLTGATLSGHGAAVRIESVPGMGRTRLLEELVVRGQLSGCTVVFTDASMARNAHGTARALVQQAFELLPELALAHSEAFSSAFTALGDLPRITHGILPSVPPPRAASGARTTPGTLPGTLPGLMPGPPAMLSQRPLAEFFAQLSQHQPLLIAVDNIEDADDASHGLLASLASIAQHNPLLLVVTEARTLDKPGIGISALRRHTRTLALDGLTRREMVEFARSMFGDAPSSERFGEWLQERAAGSPLHAIEICRRLLDDGVIRYASGLWTLPIEQPDADLPAELGDALSIRLSSLSAAARELAECLSLQRDRATAELCALLCADADDPRARAQTLLEELTNAGVLYAELGGYRFSSSALRGTLLRELTGERLENDHRRLGKAFTRLAGDDVALRIEAGFHLIQGDDGGDDLRGAELIAHAVGDSQKFRRMVPNSFRAGRPIEAALKVYRRHRRSPYEMMPLLAALTQVGYYENRYFCEQYSDEALNLLEWMSGLASARRLQRYLGNLLGLLLGMLLAYLRFFTTPKQHRPYPYREVLLQLFATVTTATGTAAISLDALRAGRVAEVLRPFAFLPERLTPVGIYQFCSALSEIACENEVAAFATFQELLRRFSSPDYYPTLPDDARTMYVAGIHFARGSFAVFYADGSAALESADALDATGIKLYAMIASQLRCLYHTARGDFAKAAPHRDQVELHAAHVGGVWQVETWEAAALILIHAVAIGELANTTRIVHRLEALSGSVPTLKLYSRLANAALRLAQRDRRDVKGFAKAAEGTPRSYIGWAATMACIVRAYNIIGEFAEAKAFGERMLAHVTEADRDLVVLFLPLDIEVAAADAALGNVDGSLQRIDALLTRFARADHPLLLGMLHEARAHICWNAKRVDDYEHSLAEVDHWYRPTGTPALIAKYERLAGLAGAAKLPDVPPANDAVASTEQTQQATVTADFQPNARRGQ